MITSPLITLLLAVGGEGQPVSRHGDAGPGNLDDRRAREAGLCGRVNDHRLGDRGEGCGQCDRLLARADREVDRIVGASINLRDRVKKRTGSGKSGAVHHVSGQQDPVLEQVKSEPNWYSRAPPASRATLILEEPHR